MPLRKARDLQGRSPHIRTGAPATEAEFEVFNITSSQPSTYPTQGHLLHPSPFDLPADSGSPPLDLNNQLSALSCHDIYLADIPPGISNADWQSSFPSDERLTGIQSQPSHFSPGDTSIPSYSGDLNRDPYYRQSMYSALQGVGYDWTDMSNYPNDQFPPNPEIPMIPESNSPLPFNARQRDSRRNFLALQDQQARSISPGHQMGSLGQLSSLGARGDMSFSSGSLPVPSHESNLRTPYPVGIIPTSMQTPPGQYISSPPQYPSNQPQYNFTSQSFRSSYHASTSPEPQRSSVATSHIPTSSPGSQSDPDNQVRVIEARPKPQCWDHGCNGREFSTFSNLLRHQRERAGASSKSECPYCGTVFTRTTARNVHISQGKCKAARESTA